MGHLFSLLQSYAQPKEFHSEFVDAAEEPSFRNDTMSESMVHIPDLFVSWAALPPRVNPLYKSMKPRVDEWFKRYYILLATFRSS